MACWFMRLFKSKNEKGFVLIGMLFLMILIAVTAVALNQRAGLQAGLAGGLVRTVQARFDREAAVENAVWELTKNPCWRTAAAGQDYTYNATTYNRKVLYATAAGFTDAVTVAVAAAGGFRPLSASFRYYIYPPIAVQPADKAVHKVCRDASNNLYFAVPDKHTVYRRNASNQQIVVVAGNGTSGFSGDGGAATAAQLNQPYGVYVKSTGDIFIADTGNHRIRKVNTAGNITTVAGTGESGFSGDGGPAVSARLNAPKGVSIGPDQKIYVADTENHKVRKFTEGGNITTIAGTGTAGFSGDGGAAISAKLNMPHSVSLDDNENVYIADTGNHCIRKVDTSGNIATVAGQGTQAGFAGDEGYAVSARLNSPTAIHITSLGGTSVRIYIADTANHRIRYVATSAKISTIAGTGTAGYSGDGGAATAARIDNPSGVFLDTAGNVVIADTNNACLRRVASGIISSLFPASTLVLNAARGIAVDAGGNLYIADAANHRVRKLDASGNVSTVAGSGAAGFAGDGGAATSARLNTPRGVAVDASGNLYVADSTNHCIRKVSTGGTITTVAGIGTQSGFAGDGDDADEAKLNMPQGVFIENPGGTSVRIYIADTGNHCIRRVSTVGNITTVAGTGTQSGFAGDGGAATSARLNAPQGVFQISGEIYVADTANHCIRKVSTSNVISTVAGIGTQSGFAGDGGAAAAAKLNSPAGVFVDAAGNLFIADSDNYRVRVVSALDSNIRTLAGSGTKGFNGEDQPAVQVRLDQPGGVAMAAGRGGRNIYISDSANNRIRILNFRMVSELH